MTGRIGAISITLLLSSPFHMSPYNQQICFYYRIVIDMTRFFMYYSSYIGGVLFQMFSRVIIINEGEIKQTNKVITLGVINISHKILILFNTRFCVVAKEFQ